jgi:hypothetical protein
LTVNNAKQKIKSFAEIVDNLSAPPTKQDRQRFIEIVNKVVTRKDARKASISQNIEFRKQVDEVLRKMKINTKDDEGDKVPMTADEMIDSMESNIGRGIADMMKGLDDDTFELQLEEESRLREEEVEKRAAKERAADEVRMKIKKIVKPRKRKLTPFDPKAKKKGFDRPEPVPEPVVSEETKPKVSEKMQELDPDLFQKSGGIYDLVIPEFKVSRRTKLFDSLVWASRNALKGSSEMAPKRNKMTRNMETLRLGVKPKDSERGKTFFEHFQNLVMNKKYNYCGSGTVMDFTKKPLNLIDKACMLHDQDYLRISTLKDPDRMKELIRQSDANLARNMDIISERKDSDKLTVEDADTVKSAMFAKGVSEFFADPVGWVGEHLETLTDDERVWIEDEILDDADNIVDNDNLNEKLRKNIKEMSGELRPKESVGKIDPDDEGEVVIDLDDPKFDDDDKPPKLVPIKKLRKKISTKINSEMPKPSPITIKRRRQRVRRKAKKDKLTADQIQNLSEEEIDVALDQGRITLDQFTDEMLRRINPEDEDDKLTADQIQNLSEEELDVALNQGKITAEQYADEIVRRSNLEDEEDEVDEDDEPGIEEDAAREEERTATTNIDVSQILKEQQAMNNMKVVGVDENTFKDRQLPAPPDKSIVGERSIRPLLFRESGQSVELTPSQIQDNKRWLENFTWVDPGFGNGNQQRLPWNLHGGRANNRLYEAQMNNQAIKYSGELFNGAQEYRKAIVPSKTTMRMMEPPRIPNTQVRQRMIRNGALPAGLGRPIQMIRDTNNIVRPVDRVDDRDRELLYPDVVDFTRV